MAIDPKAIVVAQAFKQSLEMNTTAGGTVNAHPNAFFLNVQGAVDLYKAAELALRRLEDYSESVKARFEANVKAFFHKIEAEMTAGAVTVEDALSRIKTKAGGEIIAAEGVIESAIAYVKAKEQEAAKALSDPIAKL